MTFDDAYHRDFSEISFTHRSLYSLYNFVLFKLTVTRFMVTNV